VKKWLQRIVSRVVRQVSHAAVEDGRRKNFSVNSLSI